MKTLFDKTNIKNMELKNRIIKAAVWECLATEDGHMTKDLLEIYEDLAKGGASAIITGYAHVNKYEQPNPRMMGIYDDSFINDYKELTTMVHNHNSKIILQIAYGGSKSHLKVPSPLIWGPSAVENQATKVTPTEMTKSDIIQLTYQFADAAYRAKAAGFDGVELHCAHGYLLSQFLSPYFNRRKDEYSGSIKNRARIVLGIYEECRRKTGNDFQIWIKINSEDFFEGGLTSEDSLQICKLLAAEGIDAIEVSGGNESIKSVSISDLGSSRCNINDNIENESYFFNHAKKLADTVSVPVILTGGNRHAKNMEKLLNSSKIEYFGVARPFIRQPDLAKKWKDDINAVPDCISCNACYKTEGKRCIFKR